MFCFVSHVDWVVERWITCLYCPPVWRYIFNTKKSIIIIIIVNISVVLSILIIGKVKKGLSKNNNKKFYF